MFAPPFSTWKNPSRVFSDQVNKTAHVDRRKMFQVNGTLDRSAVFAKITRNAGWQIHLFRNGLPVERTAGTNPFQRTLNRTFKELSNDIQFATNMFVDNPVICTERNPPALP
jgi:hypothetical protein